MFKKKIFPCGLHPTTPTLIKALVLDYGNDIAFLGTHSQSGTLYKTCSSVRKTQCFFNLHKFNYSDSFNKPLYHFILDHPTPRDCYDIRAQNPNSTSGVYTVYPGAIRRGLDVLCDMDVDMGGWLVSKLVRLFILTCTVLVKKYAI